MAQELSRTPALRPIVRATSGVFTLTAASTLPVLTLQDLQGMETLGMEIVVAVRSLDAFLVEMQFHPDGAWITMTAAVTTTPTVFVLAASGTLATQAAGTAWLILNVKGLYGVRISASCDTDNTGTISIKATGA